MNQFFTAADISLRRQAALDRASEIASKEDMDKRKKRYLLYLLALWLLWGESSPAEFVRRLKRADELYLPQFALAGYRMAKGMLPDVPLPWKMNASKFVNSFADGFLRDLESRTGQMDYKRRTLLYGETGIQIAYLNGVQAAMKERGAKFWQRILHPELSKSGPCDLCVADSLITHPVEESFVSLHPGDVCSMSPIGLKFTGPGGHTEFGIPGLTQNEISLFLGPGAITNVISK